MLRDICLIPLEPDIHTLRWTSIGRRLGWHKFQVERLLDLTHASRMDQIETALSALGKRLVVNAA